MGIQATLQEKQKYVNKSRNRCVPDDLEDVDGHSGDIRREAKEHEKGPKPCVHNDLEDFDGYAGDTPREAKEQDKSTNMLCTQRFGQF
jgi:hypothetical protein